MEQNAASWDRVLRTVGGVGMIVCSVFAPLPLLVRVLALGGGGVYMLGSAVLGTCLGYKMMGVSTCPIDSKERIT